MNVTVKTQKNILSSKMAKQISANVRKPYSYTAYNKTLNNST